MELITCELLQTYVGETSADRAKWHMGNGPVRYLNVFARQEYQVRIADGLLWNASGALLDTGETDVAATAGGRAIYVLDEHGGLYCSVSPHYYKFHHSSFVAGAPVACAGELEAIDGRVIYLNNRSGHYQPSEAQLTQFCLYLRSAGVDCHYVEKFDEGFRS